MKTTLEIPDALFKKTKATAALRGESLKEFMNAALEARLQAEALARRGRSGWRSVFGLAEPKQVARIDKIIAAEFETIDSSEWK